MKLYLALNEGGTVGDIALHTRISVLSARRNTDLTPVLLYTGKRNRFTEWLEAHDVKIVDSQVPYEDTIDSLVKAGRYSKATLGHWLRTNVCLEEREDRFVLYTDVDVLFRKPIDLAPFAPDFFCAAPEFDRTSWNYFNAGIMIVNIPGLRQDYDAFEAYLRANITEKTYGFHDQIAYNIFYRGRWDRLPLELNWKPYWGIGDDPAIVHFHGPKIGAIEAICDGRWNWATPHGRQIGSMFATRLAEYEHYLRAILTHAPDLPVEDHDRIALLADRVAAHDPILNGRIDTDFMTFKMFNDKASPVP